LSRTGLICFIYSVLIKIISQNATVTIFRLRRNTAIILFLFTTRDTKIAQRALCNLCARCALVVKINWEVKKKKNCGKNATVEFASGQES
jgi:hypothetical protein